MKNTDILKNLLKSPQFARFELLLRTRIRIKLFNEIKLFKVYCQINIVINIKQANLLLRL